MIQVISPPPSGLDRGPFPVQTNLRIPGPWKDPEALIRDVNRQPKQGFSIRDRTLITPQGNIQIDFAPRDDQFSKVFRTACVDKIRKRSRRELKRYQHNVLLSCHTGSLDALRTLMQAANLFLHRGGIGVFVDNGIKAHLAKTWLKLTQQNDVDAVTYAFVSVRKINEHWRTMGMNSLSRPDVCVSRAIGLPDRECYDCLVDTVFYLAESTMEFEEGHLVGDGNSPLYVAVRTEPDFWSVFEPDSPLHNPAGLLKLEPIDSGVIPSMAHSPAQTTELYPAVEVDLNLESLEDDLSQEWAEF